MEPRWNDAVHLLRQEVEGGALSKDGNDRCMEQPFIVRLYAEGVLAFVLRPKRSLTAKQALESAIFWIAEQPQMELLAGDGLVYQSQAGERPMTSAHIFRSGELVETVGPRELTRLVAERFGLSLEDLGIASLYGRPELSTEEIQTFREPPTMSAEEIHVSSTGHSL